MSSHPITKIPEEQMFNILYIKNDFVKPKLMDIYIIFKSYPKNKYITFNLQDEIELFRWCRYMKDFLDTKISMQFMS